MPYLHLPVQSGADRMLAAMNRKHDRALYLGLIDKVRAACPGIALSSDFIVGFPGESDADFADTMRLVEQVGFAAAFSFKYSRRPGTPAAALAAQVADDVATARLHALQALILDQQTAFNRATIGRTLDVLVEKPGRHPGQLTGKSPYLQPVHFDAPAALIGEIVAVRIEGQIANSLSGRLVAPGESDHANRSRPAAVALASGGRP
jgi:tRNA-2-methylthio-N6-dimethylallyladenosine synthase